MKIILLATPANTATLARLAASMINQLSFMREIGLTEGGDLTPEEEARIQSDAIGIPAAHEFFGKLKERFDNCENESEDVTADMYARCYMFSSSIPSFFGSFQIQSPEAAFPEIAETTDSKDFVREYEIVKSFGEKATGKDWLALYVFLTESMEKLSIHPGAEHIFGEEVNSPKLLPLDPIGDSLKLETEESIPNFINDFFDMIDVAADFISRFFFTQAWILEISNKM